MKILLFITGILLISCNKTENANYPSRAELNAKSDSEAVRITDSAVKAAEKEAGKSKYNIPDVKVSAKQVAETERIMNEVRAASKKSAEIRASKKSKSEIEALFSSWNGSLPSLVDYVKPKLNNPSSFEHVESEWRDDGDGLTVRMKYRAENGYGALRLGTVTAKVNYDGEILNIISKD